MSLLTNDRAQVIDAQVLVGTGLTTFSAEAATKLLLSNGLIKQAIGYVTPRTSEYTEVLDVFTGQPLELPQGYVPLNIYTIPLQNYPTNTYVYFYFQDSQGSTINAGAGNGWDDTQLNTYTYDETDSNASGLDFQGYNNMVVYNDNHPTPITSGISKVVIEYF